MFPPNTGVATLFDNNNRGKLMSLSNKTILITGANRGIGAATARELLKVGVSKIYACARDTRSLPDFGDARVVPPSLRFVTRDEAAL